MSQSNSSSSAQDLLDALIEFRQLVEKRGLGISGILRDSGRFGALMRDLHPDMNKEISIISLLINEGLLMRLHSVNANERTRVSGQIKVWLDNFGLKSEDAQAYSDVLLAFCNGETQLGIGALQRGQAAPHIPPSPSVPASPSLNNADDLFTKGASLYVKGKYREAADWFLKAANLGSADAQFMLGNMYRDGQGVAKDWNKALECYIKAAAQGHSEAKQAMLQVAAAVASPQPAAPAPSQPAAPPKPAAPKPAAPSLRNIYANKRVGECFDFGRYPQGANGEIEPITWRVLQRNADHLLVIAEQGLDCKPYNEEYCEVTWADCTLRRWLNSEFFDTAFNEQERKCILQTSIANNAGTNTDDRVFLLSVDEAERLFADNDSCCAEPTEYAVKNGVYTNNGCCWWWLRSRGIGDCTAACVDADGSVNGVANGVDIDDNAVRPAFKIAL